MSEKEKFDWCEYYILGKSYQNEKDRAKLRTGINRFYYSSFLKSRDFILENKLFLDRTSKKIMNSKTGKVHEETRHILKKHQKLNFTKKGEKIAKELDVLRNYRNIVDYDSDKPKDIELVYNYCKSRAKIIFELLKELN